MTRNLTTTLFALSFVTAGATASFAGGSSTPNPTAPSTAVPVTTAQTTAPTGGTFIPLLLSIYTR